MQEDLKAVTRFTIKCSPCHPSYCMWAPAPLALHYWGTWWSLLLICPWKVHFQTRPANFQHAVMCTHHSQQKPSLVRLNGLKPFELHSHSIRESRDLQLGLSKPGADAHSPAMLPNSNISHGLWCPHKIHSNCFFPILSSMRC